MENGFLVVTALLAGVIHTLEPDHLAAVSTFVARDPEPRKAWAFGVRWGLGHAGLVLLVGAAVAFFGTTIPESWDRPLEILVGAMLLLLALTLLLRLDPARDYSCYPSSSRPPRRSFGAVPEVRRTLVVGAIHGLGGGGAVAALLPLSVASPLVAIACLLLFGVGSVFSMGLLAAGTGLLLQRSSGSGGPLVHGFRIGAVLVTSALGMLWILGVGGHG